MVDIIVPVYNTPKDDLYRAFDSILRQTYKEYRVIIIDDGSNSDIGADIDKYVACDERFIVKHIKNHGVSYARNLGLSLANSEYVTFMDADDTICDNFLEEAVQLIMENDLDMIVGGYNEIKNGQVVKTRKAHDGLHIYRGFDRMDAYFEKLLTSKTTDSNKELGDVPTGRIYTKIYKTKIAKKVKFNEKITISEDTLYLIDLMRYVKSVGVVPNVWYNYYINDYSLSHKKLDKIEISKRLDFINEIYIRMSMCKKMELKEAFRKRIIKTYNGIVGDMSERDKAFLLKQVKDYLK